MEISSNEEYNDNVEDMNTDEEVENSIGEARKNREHATRKNTNLKGECSGRLSVDLEISEDNTPLPPSGAHEKTQDPKTEVLDYYQENPSTQSPNPHDYSEDKNQSKGEYHRDDSGKGKKVWRNFNMNTMQMGIIMADVNPKILEDKDSRIQKEDLIDPALVILSDKAREMELNLLNNIKKSMLDQFRSFKWLFHEPGDLKEKIQVIKSKKDATEDFHRLDSRVNQMEDKMKSLEETLKDIAKQNFNILKASNEHIKMLINTHRKNGR